MCDRGDPCGSPTWILLLTGLTYSPSIWKEKGGAPVDDATQCSQEGAHLASLPGIGQGLQMIQQ